MGTFLTKLKDALVRWRETDPYHYACTVCERSFQSDRSTCPDCGGDVVRAAGTSESLGVDPNP